MSISSRRAKAINEYFLEHGEKQASEKYGVTIESLHRYIRMANPSETKSHPKILLFDIETSPNVSYHWNFWKENINYNQIVKPWIIISWAGKWLFSPECFGDVLTVNEAKNSNDKRICESLRNIMDDANIIISHNCKKFDEKRSKTRFFVNKIKPPSPYLVVDTYEQLKKEFVLPSNRLDYLLKSLHDDSKLSTEFALWPKCLNWFGDFPKKTQQESLDYMFKYNKKDVFGLEEIYLDIRPYIKSHPNLALMSESEEECCPTCLGNNLKENGYYFTSAGKYLSLSCMDCGALSRRRKRMLTKKEKDNLLIPNAR